MVSGHGLINPFITRGLSEKKVPLNAFVNWSITMFTVKEHVFVGCHIFKHTYIYIYINILI